MHRSAEEFVDFIRNHRYHQPYKRRPAKIESVTAYHKVRKSLGDKSLPANPDKIYAETDIEILRNLVIQRASVGERWSDNFERFYPCLLFKAAFSYHGGYFPYLAWIRSYLMKNPHMAQSRGDALRPFLEPTESERQEAKTILRNELPKFEPLTEKERKRLLFKDHRDPEIAWKEMHYSLLLGKLKLDD